MSAQSIERIQMPDRATFFSKYVYPRRPVVITDLFAGSPIREIRTPEQASRAFGQVQLCVRREYVEAMHGRAAEPQWMTFDEYWQTVREHPDRKLLCTEQDAPARIQAQFRIPDACLAVDLRDPEILGLPRRYGDHDLFSQIFVAARGSKAHLHYDGDQRQVLLYQVFGRKEVTLFPPESTIHLPTLRNGINFLDVWLERMTPGERHDFIRANGGCTTVLEPGEAIFMPMLIWHHLGYTDDAMSLNVRFGRNKYGRFLCVDNFHRDYLLQNFAARLGDGEQAARHFAPAIREIVAEYVRPRPGLIDRIRAFRELFCRLCRDFVPEARIGELSPPATEDEQVQSILADVGATWRYLSVDRVLQSRPVGAITSAQHHHIEQHARRCRYPADLLRQIIFNRTGKREVSSLSKAEATLMLTFLATPGAQW
jgi:lysine-specific demethylase 8